jgi:hypothetical protein
MSATANPPKPVYVKPVTVAMFSTVVAAVVCVRLTTPTKGLYKNLVAVPLLVIDKLYVELSVKKLVPYTIFNNKLVCVPVTADMLVPELCVAVSGVVGTVKFPVYTATPLTMRKLEIDPFK